MKKKKEFVINLGGSIAFSKEIDTLLLRRFCRFIKKEIRKGKKFIIVVGGGAISRRYQKAASEIAKIPNEDKDWIGIQTTRVNALFLKAMFSEKANPLIFDKRFKIKKFGRYPIIIGSGWKPGWSTDFVTVQIGADFNVKEVIILGKPDYVYTADFEKDKNAQPIENMSWKDYLKIIPSQWKPGLHTPVDPVAARLAKREKMKVIVASGKDLNNLRKILKGEKFKGTILS